MKILTRFLRSSARLTMVMMTIALPSNVSSINSEMMETWNMLVLVQIAFSSVFSTHLSNKRHLSCDDCRDKRIR